MKELIAFHDEWRYCLLGENLLSLFSDNWKTAFQTLLLNVFKNTAEL